MNKLEFDIINCIYEMKNPTQREIAEYCDCSVGMVNKLLKGLKEDCFVTEENGLTNQAELIVTSSKPKNAIILAAGYGMRMAPINTECPKGLLEIYGETLIERTIRQLKAVGIEEIHVVVGFMKEQYEFLIDEYGVDLIVNSKYSEKNNLHSLALAEKYIGNTYIIPCDVWCRENPYSKRELYSWYMVTEGVSKKSTVKINRKQELALIGSDEIGNQMIGISYVADEQAKILRETLSDYDSNPRYDNAFWEDAFCDRTKLLAYPKCVKQDAVYEINTYEQLRNLDQLSTNLQSDAMDIICKALDVNKEDIVDIKVMKKGMTNRSFLFSCKGIRYIMRIPGEGTEQLINRREEASVYEVIREKNICDNIIYINPENGYKITEFIPDARVCDAENVEDLQKCMRILKDFHNQKITVKHRFDIYGQMEFYEGLWNGAKSAYRDYETTKSNCYKLKDYIEKYREEECLTHIDAIPDNFLFAKDVNGNEVIKLIDWEYAGMQDPHVDLAMFSIYSYYDKNQVDRLIDIYFEGKCSKTNRVKIYCYVAICGLLWSNWCEYKRALGVDFGEYSLKQYRYAKDFYRIAVAEMERE